MFNIYEVNSCPISFEPITDQNKRILFPCGHVFSATGLQDWSGRGHTDCPLHANKFQHICVSNNKFIELAKNQGGTVKIHDPDPEDEYSDDEDVVIPQPPPAPTTPNEGTRINATHITAKDILIKRGLLSLILGVVALGVSILLGALLAFPPAFAIGIGVCAISVVVFAILNARANRNRI